MPEVTIAPPPAPAPPTPMQRFMEEIAAPVAQWKDDIDWTGLSAILSAPDDPDPTEVLAILTTPKPHTVTKEVA